MNKQFYVDINALGDYSRYLKACMNKTNQAMVPVLKSNKLYQNLVKDNICKSVDMHARKLQKIFSDFGVKLDKISKYVKEEGEMLAHYNKPLK